jgi:hypothetical protein
MTIGDVEQQRSITRLGAPGEPFRADLPAGRLRMQARPRSAGWILQRVLICVQNQTSTVHSPA